MGVADLHVALWEVRYEVERPTHPNHLSTMTDPVILIIDALAIFRLSRLITSDTLLDTPRTWLLHSWPGADTEFHDSEIYPKAVDDKTPVLRGSGLPVVALADTKPRLWVAVKPHWFGTFISCMWCVSVWVAVSVVAARQWWDWWQWPALVAAGSAAAGWAHSRSQ